jgi:broad specificity phosphatase PhoE
MRRSGEEIQFDENLLPEERELLAGDGSGGYTIQPTTNDVSDRGLIVIVRHGQTDYLMGNKEFSDWTIEDLSRAGEARVSETGALISELLANGYPIRVVSSPMARALHTARLIVDQLLLHRNANSGSTQDTIGAIDKRIDRQLRELDNFNILSFRKACNEAFGHTMTEDETQTVLFNDDLLQHVTKLTGDSISFLDSVERASAARKRIFDMLETAHSDPTPQHWILVTHDGLAGHVVREYLAPHTSLRRGSCIVIDRGGSRKLIRTNDPLLGGKE